MMNRRMPLQEWISIPANPVQRDTELHAAKALNRHLQKSVETHQKVSMAELPDGRKFKLDGHTRAHLWDKGLLQPGFAFVDVDVYPAANEADVIRLYYLFDNQMAVETGQDKVTGLFRKHHFYPKTEWIKKGQVMTALLIASGSHNSDPNKLALIDEYIEEIAMIDAQNFSNSMSMSGLVAAMLLTLRKRGQRAMNFYTDLSIGKGDKNQLSSCPVQALSDYLAMLKASKTTGKRNNQIIFCGKTISACESYLAGRRYQGPIKFTEIAKYRGEK